MKEKAKKLVKTLIKTRSMSPEARLIEAILRKQTQADLQYETPIKLEKEKPRNNVGKLGDRKIVKEGTDYYLYIKVQEKWMKVQLEDV